MNYYLIHTNPEEVASLVGGKIHILPQLWGDTAHIIAVGCVIDDYNNRQYPVTAEELNTWLQLFGEENFITEIDLKNSGGADVGQEY